MFLSYVRPPKIKFVLLQHLAPPPAIRTSTRTAAVSWDLMFGLGRTSKQYSEQ